MKDPSLKLENSGGGVSIKLDSRESMQSVANKSNTIF